MRSIHLLRPVETGLSLTILRQLMMVRIIFTLYIPWNGITQCANNNEVAKTFATFCEHFSDVCAATTTGPSSNTNENPFPPPDSTGSSGDSSAGGDGGQVTVTVTKPPPTTTSHNAAPTARAGLAAGALAIAGLAIMI